MPRVLGHEFLAEVFFLIIANEVQTLTTGLLLAQLQLFGWLS